MRIEDLGIVLRPRLPWEAIDLGFLLVWQHWGALWRVWLSLFIPFSLLIYAVSAWWSPWLAPLLLWWLKPLYDRVLLHFFSHAVFGEFPGLRATLRHLPALFKTRLFFALTFGRLDFARSFRLPVWQLEGLAGASGRKRVALLEKGGRTQAVFLTIVCLHLEWVIYLSCAGLIYLLMPIHYDWDWETLFFGDPENLPWLLWLVQISLSLISVTIIEPLYVAAGFTLYLNRRTELEAWDIELAFRRIARRLSVFLIAPLLVLLIGFSSVPVSADTQTPQQAIEEILAHPDFQQGNWEEVWQLKKEVKPDIAAPSDFGEKLRLFFGVVAQTVEILLWSGIAFAVFMLARLAWRYAGGWQKEVKPHQAVFTPQFRVETPDPELDCDVPAQAEILAQRGELIQAMELLYRASLHVLLERDGFQPPPGTTEGECLRLMRRRYQGATTAYFGELTHAWQYAAYAQRPPALLLVQQLIADWRVYFGATRSD
jgi:hypothetical protein